MDLSTLRSQRARIPAPCCFGPPGSDHNTVHRHLAAAARAAAVRGPVCGRSAAAAYAAAVRSFGAPDGAARAVAALAAAIHRPVRCRPAAAAHAAKVLSFIAPDAAARAVAARAAAVRPVRSRPAALMLRQSCPSPSCCGVRPLRPLPALQRPPSRSL